MSISMTVSCKDPRKGCLPRCLRTHGDMNGAMSHALMRRQGREHARGPVRLCRRPAGRGVVLGVQARLSARHSARVLSGPKQPARVPVTNLSSSSGCCHPSSSWTDHKTSTAQGSHCTFNFYYRLHQEASSTPFCRPGSGDKAGWQD